MRRHRSFSTIRTSPLSIPSFRSREDLNSVVRRAVFVFPWKRESIPMGAGPFRPQRLHLSGCGRPHRNALLTPVAYLKRTLGDKPPFGPYLRFLMSGGYGPWSVGVAF